MSKGPLKSFTLEFTLVRRKDGVLTISTYLPLKALPPGVVRMHSGLAPTPEAVIVPRLTRPLQRLLKEMVQMEQEADDVHEPKSIIAAMERVILGIYQATKDGFGLPVAAVMDELIDPIMELKWWMDYSLRASNSDKLPVNTCRRFFQVLIDAARDAAQPKAAVPTATSSAPAP